MFLISSAAATASIIDFKTHIKMWGFQVNFAPNEICRRSKFKTTCNCMVTRAHVNDIYFGMQYVNLSFLNNCQIWRKSAISYQKIVSGGVSWLSGSMRSYSWPEGRKKLVQLGLDYNSQRLLLSKKKVCFTEAFFTTETVSLKSSDVCSPYKQLQEIKRKDVTGYSFTLKKVATCSSERNHPEEPTWSQPRWSSLTTAASFFF
jgi:hypothetical protein